MDPINMRYLGEPWTPAQASEGLIAGVARWRKYGIGPWMVDLVANGATGRGIGLIAFHDVDSDGTPEFGWMVHHAYWRRGIAFEAATVALQWYFERFEAAAIAKCHPANSASVSLLLKLGFSVVRTDELEVVGRLTNREWKELPVVVPR